MNGNCKDKVENCNENDYIKSLKEQISILKAQINILREDNKRLINKIEKAFSKLNEDEKEIRKINEQLMSLEQNKS